MADLTPETLAEWRKDADVLNPHYRMREWRDRRILTLLDALAAERAHAEQAEAALSGVLDDMEALGMRNDGITDTDGGRWVPCADVLDLIEKYRAAGER